MYILFLKKSILVWETYPCWSALASSFVAPLNDLLFVCAIFVKVKEQELNSNASVFCWSRIDVLCGADILGKSSKARSLLRIDLLCGARYYQLVVESQVIWPSILYERYAFIATFYFLLLLKLHLNTEHSARASLVTVLVLDIERMINCLCVLRVRLK